MERSAKTSCRDTGRTGQSALPAVEPILDDADGDIAALVYGKDERPDVVMCYFARHLEAAKMRACGLVQLRDHTHTDRCRKLVMLDDWSVLDVQPLSDDDGGRIHIDGQALDRMVQRVGDAMARGVDAVVASRFGPLELAGRGFCPVIRNAARMRTPLVIAVPKSGFESWTRFSGGMTVRLGCTLNDVLAWWHGLTAHGSEGGRARVCELVK
jgi:hypothetical protein